MHESDRLEQPISGGVEYMQSVGYPDDVIQDYRSLKPGFDEEVNEICLHTADEMRVESNELPPCLKAPGRYLNVASSVYTDIFCVDLGSKSNCGRHPVVMISHDLISYDSSSEDVEKSAIQVADSYGEFVAKHFAEQVEPDYWALKDSLSGPVQN